MQIRSYSKSELAQAYAPHLTVHGAVNRLMNWIKYNAPLYQALQQSAAHQAPRSAGFAS